MASRKIADGSPGIASTSGEPAAGGAPKKLRAVAAAVTATSRPPPRTHGRVVFLRKAYQQARATIVAPPEALRQLAQEHQDHNDSEDEEFNEEKEEQEEESSTIKATASEPLSSSKTHSKSKKTTVSEKWQTARSMVTGAGKALAHHNDMVQKIRLAAQAAFERHRLQNEMVEALSAALQADIEGAAPGISDCIEDILYDLTDAKVKDRAAVASKVLGLIMSPEEAAALQSLRDCLISQLQDDISSGSDLERVYEKLKSRVASMRGRFGVLQKLQEVPASEKRSLSKHTFSCRLEKVQNHETPTNDSSQSPWPRPVSGPKAEEGKPAWKPRPESRERLSETQPTLQPSAQPVLVSEAPAPCPAPIELSRQATLQQEAFSPADEDESTVGNTSRQYVMDNRERHASNEPNEVPTDNGKGDDDRSSRSAHILMQNSSSQAEEGNSKFFTSGDSANIGEQSQRRPQAEAEHSRQKVEPPAREIVRPQGAPPVELNRLGFGALDLPPVLSSHEDCTGQGNFEQDNFFEMIVVGRSPRSKPPRGRQLNMRFPLLPMFPRTPREDQLPFRKFDPCRSVAKAVVEVFPSLRSHAATTQRFLPVLPKTPDAGQLMTQSWRSSLGSAPSFSIGNSDRAQTWNGRSFM